MSLVACSLLLVPEQGTRLLGIEWIALALAFGIFLLWTYLRVDIANAGGRTVVVGRIVTHILVAVLFLAAGVATAASLGGGSTGSSPPHCGRSRSAWLTPGCCSSRSCADA